jgi:hypothetical protein
MLYSLADFRDRDRCLRQEICCDRIRRNNSRTGCVENMFKMISNFISSILRFCFKMVTNFSLNSSAIFTSEIRNVFPKLLG